MCEKKKRKKISRGNNNRNRKFRSDSESADGETKTREFKMTHLWVGGGDMCIIYTVNSVNVRAAVGHQVVGGNLLFVFAQFSKLFQKLQFSFLSLCLAV